MNFRLDRAAAQDLLNATGGFGFVEDVLDQAAQRALAAAESGAPVASGAYRNSLQVVTVRTDRMVKRVLADVGHAMQVEAVTGNLSRSIDAAAQ